MSRQSELEARMSPHTPKIGETVQIKEGWGYFFHDPIAFHRSHALDAPRAVVTAIKGQTCYLAFQNGRKGEARLDAVRPA